MKPKLVMQKGAQSDDYGTPVEVLDVVRSTFDQRPIEYDMASSARWNRIVKASYYYSLARPCPRQSPVERGDLVWCNPPATVKLVRWFWDTWNLWVHRHELGAFLVYQIDHWRSLTNPVIPCWCLVWPKRLKYIGAPHQANFSSVLVLTRPPKNTPRDAVVVRWAP